MKLRVVSFETAKKLKEVGFRQTTDWGYNSDGTLNPDNILSTVIDAPTLALVQMWLMERHNLHIRIMTEFYRDGINYNWQVLEYDTSKELCIGKETGWYGDNGEYPSYNKALEAGILEAIKLIQS